MYVAAKVERRVNRSSDPAIKRPPGVRGLCYRVPDYVRAASLAGEGAKRAKAELAALFFGYQHAAQAEWRDVGQFTLARC